MVEGADEGRCGYVRRGSTRQMHVAGGRLTRYYLMATHCSSAGLANDDDQVVVAAAVGGWGGATDLELLFVM